MKRFLLAILLVTAVAAAVFLALNRPPAEASPDVTITVDSTDDTVDPDDGVLTLREAMMLATGERILEDLSFGECSQVSGTLWTGLDGCISSDPPGDTSADTIVFDLPFPSDTIELSDTLPALHTGDDTVDGSAAEVIVEGGGADISDFDCFDITSNSNTIKGLEIRNCHLAVKIHAGAQNNTIGGSTQPERNVISGNYRGVFILDDGTEDNTVTGNFIGTDPSGTFAVANGIGVFIGGGTYNKIGGSAAGQRNVISGNDGPGVLFSHDAAGNTVIGNYIGTDASGTSAIPNGQQGVSIRIDSQNNTVGGIAPGAGNIIAFNAQDGVRVHGPATTGNAIRRNSIHSNGGQGIATQEGGNTDLPPPVVTGFGSVMGTACPNCTIDLFSDDEDEGRVYEGSFRADGAGNWSTLPGWPEGPNVTATATDSDGNTSEFSDPVAVPEATPTPTATATATPTTTPVPSNGDTRTLDWDPGWHNETWSGASTPAEAFACAAGDYAAAYRLVGAGFQRYFPDRLDVSNMTDLEQYDTFFILITDDVTCHMFAADPLDTDRTLDWDVGWHNDAWTGPDDTDPEDAFACPDGSYAAAYRLADGAWQRHFPDRDDISNMGPLNTYDAFLILVTAPVTCTMPIAP